MTSDADRRDAFVKPSGNHRYLRAADHVQFVAIDRISRLAARRLSGHGAAGPADYGWQERAADFFCEAADFRVAVGLGGVAGEVSVFEDDTINLLMVRTCQSPLSAALIGWVEAHVAEPAEKNALCDPVPSPAAPVDWLRMWAATLRNTSRWRRRPDLDAWLRDCRLNSMNAFLRGVRPDNKEKFAILKRAGETGAAAAARIPDLLSA